ncbi:MAG: hypothetical protein K2N87_12210 [Eubacterium sp.]|nr:hypothetical protein [Eubacterium sp.]
MKFFMIISKKALYTYQKNGQGFEPQFIEGSNLYPYNSSSICEDINAYLEALAYEKNLGTKAKLEFDILESTDQLRNAEIFRVLEDYTDKRYQIDDALKTVLKKLSRDKKLMISEYGINYDGYSYKLSGDIEKKEFDLLAYTVHSEDMVGLMNLE